MPQNRLYDSNADRQHAYRVRNRANRSTRSRKAAPSIPTGDDPKAWDAYLTAVGLAMTRGEFMADAPHGKGRLETGRNL
jgi:hypothetical protein